MSLSEEIVDRNFGRDGGELWIGGVPVSRIVALHGTPLFVYDRSVMTRKLTLLRQALPPGFDVYYSIKANPNQAILKCFVGEGCGLEVASGGELHQALAAGCDPRRILFAGPGKTSAELEYALVRKIGEIHVESLDEIVALSGIARRLGLQAEVAVRVNPLEEAQGGAMRMGGTPSPFGVDEETLDAVLDRILACGELVLGGVHLFAGTQILSHEVLVRQYGKGLAIARRVARRLGRPLKTVDFGGGLGIPYFDSDRELDLEALRPLLAELFREPRNEPEFARTNFIVEPGRFLVGESGVYVTRVTSVKRSRGKSYLVVDGGMNHHLAASGNLGQVIKRNFPAAVINKLDAERNRTANVVGPLCTPLDMLARETALPATEVGDLFGVFQSGAYARAASPLGFLSHPTPPELLTDEGRLELIRRRGEYEDLLSDQGQGPR